MAFWNRRKRKIQDTEEADRGKVQRSKKTVKRSPPVALEVKLVAIEALSSGLSPKDVAEIVGVAAETLDFLRRLCARRRTPGRPKASWRARSTQSPSTPRRQSGAELPCLGPSSFAASSSSTP